MLTLNRPVVDAHVEIDNSRTNDKYIVVRINGVAVMTFDKATGAYKPVKLGPNNKRDLTACGVGYSGDYINKRS